MKRTPLAAFGYIMLLAEANAGEENLVAINELALPYCSYYYYTKGRATSVVIETGQILEDRVPGWLNTEHPGTGSSTPGTTVRSSFPEDTAWLSIKQPSSLINWSLKH
jgi:hypothetical protein